MFGGTPAPDFDLKKRTANLKRVSVSRYYSLFNLQFSVFIKKGRARARPFCCPSLSLFCSKSKKDSSLI